MGRRRAVADPDVLAIKQTVYRTSDDWSRPDDATEGGKGPSPWSLARFDERMSIHWAKAEEAGVHVVYGQPALKTHVKCVLVVRRGGGGGNFVRIGTATATPPPNAYIPTSLFTTDEGSATSPTCSTT